MTLPQGEQSPFCETPQWEEILRVIELSMMLKEMGAIVGAPGVGKTMALKHYLTKNDRARYVSASPANSQPREALSMISEALGNPIHAKNRGVFTRYQEVRELLLRPDLDVLLIDEAQHLNSRSLDYMRTLWDTTGTPIVFAGNFALRERVNVHGEEAFVQFASRIGPKATIDTVTPEAVEIIAMQRGVTDRAAVKWLKSICATKGGLRLLDRLITTARLVNQDRAIGMDELVNSAVVLGEAA